MQRQRQRSNSTSSPAPTLRQRCYPDSSNLAIYGKPNFEQARRPSTLYSTSQSKSSNLPAPPRRRLIWLIGPLQDTRYSFSWRLLCVNHVREHRNGGGGRHAENECRRQNEEAKAANRRRRRDPHKGAAQKRTTTQRAHKAANRRPQRDPNRKHTDKSGLSVSVCFPRPPALPTLL